MAAKIRAMELLPNAATDKEYLKLYGVIFLGAVLTLTGINMFFRGFPVLIGWNPGVGRVVGFLFGGIVWGVGTVPLLAGLVALSRKVILETTREDLLDVDRLVDGHDAGDAGSGAGATGESDDAVDEAKLRAGGSGSGSSTRAKPPASEDGDTVETEEN